MNKKLSRFFQSYGMEISGDRAYGVIKDYEVNAVYSRNDSEFLLKLHISFYATDERKGKIEDSLHRISKSPILYAFTPYGLTIGFRYLIGGFAKRLSRVMDIAFRALGENGIAGKDYCPVCGKLLGIVDQPCEIDGMKIRIDADCVDKLNAKIRAENKALQETPDNCLKGFFGALIGGLVGAVAAAIIYIFGFISGWSAALALMLGVSLYQKFGGKPNGKMLVIVSLTTIVCMLLSVFFCYVAAAVIATGGGGMNPFEAFIDRMDAKLEFAVSFAADLFSMFAFSAFAVFVEVRQMRQKVKRQRPLLR
ncbi:MAG: hypothetical protein J6D37_08380 [Clostridia bacterium]|nr:hypothetical protein [Clostridia bacterium]